MVTFNTKNIGSLLFVILAHFSFVRPAIIYHSGMITIDRTIRNLAIVILVYLILRWVKYIKEGGVIKYIIIFFLITLCITILHSMPLMNLLRIIIYTLGLCLLVDIYMREGKGKILVKGIFISYCILLGWNFIWMTHQVGFGVMAGNHLDVTIFGHNNILVYYAIPGLLFAFLHSYYTSSKLGMLHLVLMFIIGWSVLIAWSAAGVVGWAVFMTFAIFFYKRKAQRFFSMKSAIIVYTILFVGIVILRLQVHFSFIIENILNRYVHLTGREYIWDNVMIMIRESWLYGYGHGFRALPFDAHNRLLEILLQGGIISLISYISIYVCILYRLRVQKNSLIVHLFSAAIMSLMLVNLVDSAGGNFMYFAIFVLCNYCDDMKLPFVHKTQNEVPYVAADKNYRLE